MAASSNLSVPDSAWHQTVSDLIRFILCEIQTASGYIDIGLENTCTSKSPKIHRTSVLSFLQLEASINNPS